jgi:hypothetical protein
MKLSDADRNRNFASPGSNDGSLTHGWYRFMGAANGKYVYT